MISNSEYLNEYVPMHLWGKDHWSLLAYIETVMVEFCRFQVGFDCRMRQNRRNFRVMKSECPSPKRSGVTSEFGIIMDPKYGTRLNNNTYIEGHDDWMCVQDFADAGLFLQGVEDVEPGEELTFSPKGLTLATNLRAHKMAGGSFSNYTNYAKV